MYVVESTPTSVIPNETHLVTGVNIKLGWMILVFPSFFQSSIAHDKITETSKNIMNSLHHLHLDPLQTHHPSTFI